MRASTATGARAALLGLVVAAGLAGCGGSDDAPAGTGTSTAAAQQMTQIKLPSPPSSGAAYFLLGVDKGFFKDEGIDLQLDASVPPPQIIPAVVSGKSPLAVHASGIILSARANGVPLEAIAGVATGGQDLASDDIQLVTLEGSDVKTAADLAGKTIALPQLGGAAELTVRELARQNGVDQGSLKFAQLNFPDMPPALRAGRIDAAYLSEPFLAQIKGQTKIRALGSGATAIAPELPLAAVVTTEAYAKKNPELIAAFRRANKRSADYAVAHPDELLEYVPDALGVPKEVAAQIIPPQVNATIDEAKLQKMGDLMFEYKQIPKRVDVHDFVRQDAQ